MKQRVLIWGSGAIGGIVGGLLTQAGHDVLMVDVDLKHVEAMRDPTHGLTISGPVSQFRGPVKAVLPAEVKGTWPCILLAVRSYATETASRALLPHLATDGYVVSLQNGFCEDIIAKIVGHERTIGCFLNFAGDVIAPGHIHFGLAGPLIVGELTGRITSRVLELCTLLRDALPEAEATSDILGFLWGKMVFAVLLYASALGQESTAELLSRSEFQPAWQRLCREVVAVALAAGMEPRSFTGFNPRSFVPDAAEGDARSCINATAKFLRAGQKSHSGTWRELAEGRPRTEATFQLENLSKIAEHYGIPCPGLRQLLVLLRQAESGHLSQNNNNLRLLLS